jgi:DUF4097 and DUF4098 domain-containing protein YvlB
MTTTQLSSQLGARLALVIFPIPLFALAGCAAVMGNQVKAEKKEQRAFTVSAQPSVIVETFNGEIHVQAITENKVEATVTKLGSGANKEAAEADLQNVNVSFTQEGETIRIVAKRTVPKTFGSSGASVDLKVPAGSALSLTTQNGEIGIAGTSREVMARSSNGNIDIQGGKGKLDLSTSNGTIEIDAAEAIVNAESTNGNVAFTGTLSKGTHSLETSNGSIDLKLPATSQFQFAASTSNGSVTSRFPGLQTKSGRAGSNRLAGLVGSGPVAEVDLKLETSNGTITIEPVQQAEASKP